VYCPDPSLQRVTDTRAVEGEGEVKRISSVSSFSSPSAFFLAPFFPLGLTNTSDHS